MVPGATAAHGMELELQVLEPHPRITLETLGIGPFNLGLTSRNHLKAGDLGTCYSLRTTAPGKIAGKFSFCLPAKGPCCIL